MNRVCFAMKTLKISLNAVSKKTNCLRLSRNRPLCTYICRNKQRIAHRCSLASLPFDEREIILPGNNSSFRNKPRRLRQTSLHCYVGYPGNLVFFAESDEAPSTASSCSSCRSTGPSTASATKTMAATTAAYSSRKCTRAVYGGGKKRRREQSA